MLLYTNDLVLLDILFLIWSQYDRFCTILLFVRSVCGSRFVHYCGYYKVYSASDIVAVNTSLAALWFLLLAPKVTSFIKLISVVSTFWLPSRYLLTRFTIHVTKTQYQYLESFSARLMQCPSAVNVEIVWRILFIFYLFRRSR